MVTVKSFIPMTAVLWTRLKDLLDGLECRWDWDLEKDADAIYAASRSVVCVMRYRSVAGKDEKGLRGQENLWKHLSTIFFCCEAGAMLFLRWQVSKGMGRAALSLELGS